MSLRHEIATDGGQSATTVDGAKHGAACDVYRHVAAHTARRKGIAREATTTAEDVAIHVAGAPGADIDIATNGQIHIAQHVTVLTAAEHGAVDAAAGDLHLYLAHIGVHVEIHDLVALTGTEEVAGHGVSGYLCQRAGHAERSARHADGGLALTIGQCSVAHVGQLASAVGTGQDVAALDL